VDWEAGVAARVDAPLNDGPMAQSRWFLNFTSYDAYTGVKLKNTVTT